MRWEVFCMSRKDVQGSVRRKSKCKWRDKKAGVTSKDLAGQGNFSIVLGIWFCVNDLLLMGLRAA